MMIKQKKWLIAGVTASAFLLFSTFTLANTGAGGQTDPLITRSYLEQYVTPSLEEKANAKAEVEMNRLLLDLEEELAVLRKEVEAAGGTSSQNMEQYTVVTLTQGEKILLDLGTQVVLRVGAATVEGTYDPVLVNLTQGTTLDSGGTLITNHLYLSTIEGRSITALSGVTKVLVYGGYQKI